MKSRTISTPPKKSSDPLDLDEHDDVQKVYHNGDLPAEAFEA